MSINLLDVLKSMNNMTKASYAKRRKAMYSDYDDFLDNNGGGPTFEDLERFDTQADEAYESRKEES